MLAAAPKADSTAAAWLLTGACPGSSNPCSLSCIEARAGGCSQDEAAFNTAAMHSSEMCAVSQEVLQ